MEELSLQPQNRGHNDVQFFDSRSIRLRPLHKAVFFIFIVRPFFIICHEVLYIGFLFFVVFVVTHLLACAVRLRAENGLG